VRGEAGGPATAVIALAVGGAVTLPAALVRGAARRREGRRLGARGVGLLVALGVANAANTWFYFRALAEGSVAPAALTHDLAPIIVAVVAPLALGERSSPRTPPALVLALGGTALLLLGGAGAGGLGGAAARHAALLGGASAVFYATTVLINKRLLGLVAPVELFSLHCLISGAVLLPITALPADPGAWLRPALGGLLSCTVAGLVYFAGLRRLPAERAGVLSTLEVVSGVLVGWIGYGERPGQAALAGGVGILVAGMLVMTASR
jgi:drug/metabolite transporter (DMT)-like permease